MKLTKKTLAVTTALALSGLLLAGCTAPSNSDTDAFGQTTTKSTTTTEPAELNFVGDLGPTEVLAANADYTTVKESEWSESGAVDVKLSGSSASSSSQAVQVSGSTVTITQAGVYRISGSLTGQLVVAAPDDAQVVLILDGATISNSAGAAIDVQTADDVAIHLATGTTNTVSDASSYAEDAEANAAIYSAEDLTISGTGALVVNANGNDGITSKDDLVILSGDITVTAADDALRGKDSLVVKGGTLALTAKGGDGLKSDQDSDATKGYVYVKGGTITIDAGDDGIQATTDTIITGGTITIAAADDGIKGDVTVSIGGGDITVSTSTEGIEAPNIGIFGGTINVTASDDGINGSGNSTVRSEADSGERVEISGGTITIKARTDGIDSNGSITITGGVIDITSAANGGDGPLDANGKITVSNATITANGAPYDPATAQQMGPGGQGGGFPGGGGGGPRG